MPRAQWEHHQLARLQVESITIVEHDDAPPIERQMEFGHRGVVDVKAPGRAEVRKAVDAAVDVEHAKQFAQRIFGLAIEAFHGRARCYSGADRVLEVRDDWTSSVSSRTWPYSSGACIIGTHDDPPGRRRPRGGGTLLCGFWQWRLQDGATVVDGRSVLQWTLRHIRQRRRPDQGARCVSAR